LATFLLQSLEGKLDDQALELIGTRVQVTNWEELKAPPTDYFRDKKNEELNINEVNQTKPKKNKSPISDNYKEPKHPDVPITSKSNVTPTIQAVQRYSNNYPQTFAKIPGQLLEQKKFKSQPIQTDTVRTTVQSTDETINEQEEEEAYLAPLDKEKRKEKKCTLKLEETKDFLKAITTIAGLNIEAKAALKVSLKEYNDEFYKEAEQLTSPIKLSIV
ncbi:hypothetical protein ILUMI_21452, partial [Ignelater luminosus]